VRRAPKLWRRKKGGKFVGNWFVTIKDVPVNLGTKDASKAGARRSDALNGSRKFQDDVDGAADDTAAALTPKPPVVVPPLPPELEPAPAPEVPPVDAATAGDLPVDGDDDDGTGEAWEESVAAAVGETDGTAEPGVPVVPPPADFNLSIEQVMQILGLPPKELAPLAVEVQLKAHEAIAGVFGFDELNTIPESSRGRAVLTVGYVPVIELLQADKIRINPGWFILVGSLMLAREQLKGVKRNARKKADAPAGQ
jgi:hypothetical protein